MPLELPTVPPLTTVDICFLGIGCAILAGIVAWAAHDFYRGRQEIRALYI